MRFAASVCGGRLLDAAHPGESTRGVCFACSGGVALQGGEWVHLLGDKKACRLVGGGAATAVASVASTTTTPAVGVVRYSPPVLGGAASLYLTADPEPPPGWRFATWAPSPVPLRVDGGAAPESLRVLLRGDETLEGERVASALLPTDEEGRRVLQRFHRAGLLHVDPASPELPRWRAVRAPPGGGKTTLLMDLAAAWPQRRFLLVTFARDIAEELRQRALQAEVTNLVVKTVDALCYAAEFDTAGGQGDVVFQLSDREVVEACFPRCRPWYKKRSGANLGPLVEHLLRHLPVGVPLEGLLCEKHAPFRWILEELVAPAATKPGLCHLRRSFSSMRGRAARTPASARRLRQLPAVASADVLLVDEAQDLTPQALQILRCLGKPTLAVGDPRQSVYDYVDCRVCPDCLERLEAVEASRGGGFAGAEEATTVELYETHRLDPLSCRVLEEWTGGRLGMVSSRGEEEASSPIRRVPRVPPAPDPILYLVRSNREVVEATSRDPSLGVVGGASLARELRHHAKARAKAGKTTRAGREWFTAMEALAFDLAAKGDLEVVCGQLEQRDAALAAASQGGRVVSSVHRCKGAQAPHVVVEEELLLPEEEGEFCVSVVAGTRHTQRLSVVARRDDDDAPTGRKRPRGAK